MSQQDREEVVKLLSALAVRRPTPDQWTEWKRNLAARSRLGQMPRRIGGAAPMWPWWLVAGQFAAFVLALFLIPVNHDILRGQILSIETSADSKQSWLALRDLSWWHQATWTVMRHPGVPGHSDTARLHAVLSRQPEEKVTQWVHELTQKKWP